MLKKMFQNILLKFVKKFFIIGTNTNNMSERATLHSKFNKKKHSRFAVASDVVNEECDGICEQGECSYNDESKHFKSLWNEIGVEL